MLLANCTSLMVRQAKRRSCTAKYETRILAEADACTHRAEVLALLASGRFVDVAPEETYATLLDEGNTCARPERCTGSSPRRPKILTLHADRGAQITALLARDREQQIARVDRPPARPGRIWRALFESFNERGRQVVVLAQGEARALMHNHIGTEHILLGLLGAEDGLAAQALASLGVTAARARAQVVKSLGSGEEASPSHIPFTPRAKKALELAPREVLSRGDRIDTEHVLLGLLRNRDSGAIRVLADLGANPAQLRDHLTKLVASGQARQRVGACPPFGEEAALAPGVAGAQPTVTPGTSGGAPAAWVGRSLELIGPLGDEIRATLRREPDAGDLLLALACLPQTLAAAALREFNVDLDALWGALEHARGQAARVADEAASEQERVQQKLRELESEIGQAIEAHDLERAAALRDQARALREQVVALGRRSSAADAAALPEIRRRLGLPAPPPAGVRF